MKALEQSTVDGRQLPDFTLIRLPVPGQARSQQALERLLAAGEALLADNRYEEASVAEIAKLAQSSVGSFYRLLGDKDALSLLLLQQFMQRVAATATDLAEVRCEDLSQSAAMLVNAYVDIYTGHRGVLRALILRASRSADFRDKVHLLNRHVSGCAQACMEPFTAEIRHPKPRQAVSSGMHMVLGALNQYTVTGNLGELPADELRPELIRLLLGYLDQGTGGSGNR
ncbi:MAG: TetR/AcrR family transcriptional regulator [Cellvibrionaceae bacterium]